ncbi:MAG: hypothetical protein LH472_14910 [Pyrinomonadaceae bacterium]|nr:hypothetical protein [Pyrinomonadaceae bacterium]
MQDIQNIPNPDVNSPETDEDYGRIPHSDIERPNDSIPVPPDEMPPPVIDEPTDVEPQPKIDEDNTEPKMIV